MKVILIGYRASGKSSVGKRVAKSLSLEFLDIDEQIMARYDNRSVADIWSQFGEPHFRETECDVTEFACQQNEIVIALGGGTPMQYRAYKAIEDATDALRVYLKAPAGVLFARSQSDTSNLQNRPGFSNDRSGLDEVKHVLEIREPTYEKLADKVIDVEKTSLESIVEQIVDWASKIKTED